jgi:hypothetical protein
VHVIGREGQLGDCAGRTELPTYSLRIKENYCGCSHTFAGIAITRSWPLRPDRRGSGSDRWRTKITKTVYQNALLYIHTLTRTYCSNAVFMTLG